MSDYKKIEVPLARSSDLGLLNSIFSKYPREDIYFELKNDSVIIHMRQIDLANFRKEIEQIEATENSAPQNSINTLGDILKKIEAIKSYGLKGKKRLYVGYNKERKVADRKQKEGKREVYFYATDHGYTEKNNELPHKFTNKIICGDSEAILSKLPDNCVDIIFTSPPYNFGLEYSSNDDASRWQSYFNKLFSIFDQCIRVLKFGGRIIINVQPLFSDYIPSHHIISNYFMQKKLIWKGEILWEKNNYNCKYTAWGSWKSPSSPYLKYTWEFLEIFAKGSLVKKGSKRDIDITAEEFKKWVVAKWSIAPERKMQELGHPAVFPEDLVLRVLKLFSFAGDVVLDPFNGVGTTPLVAKYLNRRYLGIDISEKYCRVAEDRLRSIML